MNHPIPIEKLPPQVAKLCGPKAPPPMKAMAAGGLAPLKPQDLVTVLYVLSFDPDAKIAGKAKQSLVAIPDNILLGALDLVAEADILDGLSQLLLSKPQAMQKLMLNKNVQPETVVWVATRSADDRTLEIIAANEDRLLKNPRIIEALYNNKATRMSTVDRAVELAARNNVDLPGIASFAEAKAALAGELLSETTEEMTPDDRAFVHNLESADWKELDDATVDAAYEETSGEQIKGKKQVESVEQSLARLTVSAKVRVATLGNSTQRSVLIRDSNKLVVLAVVKSPALTESEVMRFVKFRSLPAEAVRYLAGNREWTKHYPVKLSLVQNPRCPIELALRFMPHLRLPDLKLLARDKNIPQAVARAAKQLQLKRTR